MFQYLKYSSYKCTDNQNLQIYFLSYLIIKHFFRYNRPIGKEKEYCWESYVCKARNMMRKEELDWKMVNYG